MNSTGQIHEVFSSFQGEGPRAGERHAFVRLSRCNLACAYCDTAGARETAEYALFERPGGETLRVKNPVPADVVAGAVDALETYPGRHAAVAITGGEPLHQADFLLELLAALRGKYTLMLETNGTLPDAMERAAPLVDVVSMDVKLPSVSGLGGMWELHERFIRAAAGREVIVKAVAGPHTPAEEVARAAGIAALDPAAVFVIQPLTPFGGVPEGGEWQGRLYDEARRRCGRVRVIPQIHKLLNIR